MLYALDLYFFANCYTVLNNSYTFDREFYLKDYKQEWLQNQV